jgi:hypothetical protein
VTWTARESNRGWYGVACSADGTKLVAVVSNGQIYTSVLVYNVGIGTSTPLARLNVNGGIRGTSLALTTNDATKPSTNTWTITSDVRVKTNIEDADTSMCYSTLKNLHLKRYTYDLSYANIYKIKDHSVVGWIAQDVEKVFPKAVTITDYDSNTQLSNFYGLDVDQIYKTMYGALHKVIEDKERLEAEVQEAKGKMGHMEEILHTVTDRLLALEQSSTGPTGTQEDATGTQEEATGTQEEATGTQEEATGPTGTQEEATGPTGTQEEATGTQEEATGPTETA